MRSVSLRDRISNNVRNQSSGYFPPKGGALNAYKFQEKVTLNAQMKHFSAFDRKKHQVAPSNDPFNHTEKEEEKREVEVLKFPIP